MAAQGFRPIVKDIDISKVDMKPEEFIQLPEGRSPNVTIVDDLDDDRDYDATLWFLSPEEADWYRDGRMRREFPQTEEALKLYDEKHQALVVEAFSVVERSADLADAINYHDAAINKVRLAFLKDCGKTNPLMMDLTRISNLPIEFFRSLVS